MFIVDFHPHPGGSYPPETHAYDLHSSAVLCFNGYCDGTVEPNVVEKGGAVTLWWKSRRDGDFKILRRYEVF